MGTVRSAAKELLEQSDSAFEEANPNGYPRTRLMALVRDIMKDLETHTLQNITLKIKVHKLESPRFENSDLDEPLIIQAADRALICDKPEDKKEAYNAALNRVLRVVSARSALRNFMSTVESILIS
jgi:hypothetical protein